MLSARQLHERGVVAINDGLVRAARPLLERALAAADEDDLAARVEASLAYVVAELDGPAAALALLERSALRTETSALTRGIVASQRALLLMRLGETAAALREFGSAIAALGSEPGELGRAELNRGGVHLQQGEVAAAVRDFTLAAGHLRAADLTTEAAKAEHNGGYARFLAGDLVGALALMEPAARVLAPLGEVSRAIGEQDRAEVLMAAGLVEEGRAALRSAARDYGTRRLRRRQAEAELVLARSLVWDDPAGARRIARRAARRFAAVGAEAWAARAEALALIAEVDTGRHSSDLLERGDHLADQLVAQGLRDQATDLRLHLVRAELARGRVAEARARAVAVRPGSRARLATRLLDRDVRAELVGAGRPTLALRHLREGLADVHAWQSSFGSLDLQTGVAGHGVRLGVRGLALAVESRRPAVLLEWSERARMLASRVQPVRAPEDPDLVADLTELRADPSPAREAELRQRVRERAWQHRGSGAVVDPVTLPDLQAALDAGTALVAYVVTATDVVALVVTAEAATWVDLGGRSSLDALLGGLLPDLDMAAADLAEPLAGAVRRALAARLEELAGLLVAPVLAAVGDRRVVLTPSGVLAGVPWPLLPGYVGRPVTVAQSATSWLARRTTPLRTAAAGFVAGPRVLRAQDEVDAAAREWAGARVLVGGAATAGAVSELAEQVDVLHVAAHGRHSAENPLFSGLLLADGSWFGYDVDRLRAVPDVVLLSACEVGRSTVRWGEELIGMSTAWLHAGARCVIASAAAVNDRAAYEVLVTVHRHLATGADPAAALAAAVPAVSDECAPVPLVCFG
ncbi:CHAT domain-containing protein [Nocardioides dongkuii]|uniref:CHAT domain-containing protein n=1 Tax=Nocardioides dongkuii TaxID=2760089 RepID=UPI00187793B6|nr:CHAT domain-containing protein [Nocardioides dongkuii]